jgi:hypothetical protein
MQKLHIYFKIILEEIKRTFLWNTQVSYFSIDIYVQKKKKNPKKEHSFSFKLWSTMIADGIKFINYHL